uniref:Uncharacterized protein n=1 Tax=Anguilla anguilla TaxID=7936 RepID=A0A0E9VX77_ANGAN
MYSTYQRLNIGSCVSSGSVFLLSHHNLLIRTRQDNSVQDELNQETGCGRNLS